eukprot:a678051_27.p1 GENE.a678051_27~~a678051_27.p1  ORF type:complete len:141 (+),score=37.24 a678051_27:54-425(+)
MSAEGADGVIDLEGPGGDDVLLDVAWLDIVVRDGVSVLKPASLDVDVQQRLHRMSLRQLRVRALGVVQLNPDGTLAPEVLAAIALVPAERRRQRVQRQIAAEAEDAARIATSQRGRQRSRRRR